MHKVSNHAEAASRAHCERVAAYCEEIAISLAMTADSRRRIQHLASTHHNREGASSWPAALLRDCIGPEVALQTMHPEPLPDNCDSDRLALILEMADQFDEEIEFAPYTDDRLIDILNRKAGQTPAVSFVLPHLRGCTRADLNTQIPRLPVFSGKAVEVMRLLRQQDIQIEALISVAASDQVLTGHLLRAANSAYYGRKVPASNLRQAVTYIGTQRAAQVLLAGAMKPFLAVPGLEGLWQHSIHAAQVSEALAQRSSEIDPGDAYVLGLLHDVGKLLLKLVPPYVTAVRERLVARGVPPAVAEIVTCGADHAEAGGDVVRYWGLPEEYAQAVAYHHDPERVDSQIASLLYLVEFWTGSEEDLPSTVRLRSALDRMGMTLDEMQQMPMLESALSAIV